MASYLVMIHKNDRFELYRETEAVEFICSHKMQLIKKAVKEILNP